MRPQRRERDRKFSGEKDWKDLWEGTQELLEAGKGGCFLGGCFVHFAPLSNGFWPVIKRFPLTCL